jgi:plasmid stabilization system protein ParE
MLSTHPLIEAFLESQMNNGATETQAWAMLRRLVIRSEFHHIQQENPAEYAHYRRDLHSTTYAIFKGQYGGVDYHHNHGYREDHERAIFAQVVEEQVLLKKGLHGPDSKVIAAEVLQALELKSANLVKNAGQVLRLNQNAGMIDKTDDRVRLAEPMPGAPPVPVYVGDPRLLSTWNVIGPQGQPLLTVALADPQDLTQPLSRTTLQPLVDAIIATGMRVKAAQQTKNKPGRDALSVKLALLQASGGVVIYLDGRALLKSGWTVDAALAAWIGRSPLPSVASAWKHLAASPAQQAQLTPKSPSPTRVARTPSP